MFEPNLKYDGQDEANEKEPIAEPIAPQVSEIEELFKSLDIDGDGNLTFQEIRERLQGRKNSEFIYMLLVNADTDGS